MECLQCNNKKTNVINSRPRAKSFSVWRRRKCPKCHHLFSTEETVSLHDTITVIKSNGTELPYSRGVLLYDIIQAFAHDTQKGAEASWWLLQSIEAQITKSTPDASTATTAEIIYHTSKVLLKYDKLAGIQYGARHGISA